MTTYAMSANHISKNNRSADSVQKLLIFLNQFYQRYYFKMLLTFIFMNWKCSFGIYVLYYFH